MMKKILLAFMLAGASATASADSWIYGSASIGQSKLDGQSATSFNAHVGTGILPFFGLEAGYQKLGTFDQVKYDNKTHRLDASTMYFAVKPSIDFGPLHIYAKAGLHSYALEDENAGFKEKKVNTMHGVGVEYFIISPISIGASYNVYTLDKDKMDNLALNASFHFL